MPRRWQGPGARKIDSFGSFNRFLEWSVAALQDVLCSGRCWPAESDGHLELVFSAQSSRVRRVEHERTLTRERIADGNLEALQIWMCVGVGSVTMLLAAHLAKGVSVSGPDLSSKHWPSSRLYCSYSFR